MGIDSGKAFCTGLDREESTGVHWEQENAASGQEKPRI